MPDNCPKCGAEKRDPPYGGGVWCPEMDGLHCVRRQAEKAEAERDALAKRATVLEKALPPPARLRLLADWIDAKYPDDADPEMQGDLRIWADRAQAALDAKENAPAQKEEMP